MSLNFGRTQLAIPGPSIIPDRVLNAMHRASPNIYSGELEEITKSIIPDLKAVACTEGDVAIYIANGHGVWEAALRNIVNPGEKLLLLGTGRFAENWAGMAESLGIKTQLIEFGMQSPADPARLEDALLADKANEIKAVLMVQTDTASSVRNDVHACGKAITNAGHDALFVVDCIASLGCDEYRMDDWGADVTIAACQKGLMTPAGIAFIYFNEKAQKVRERAAPGEYWDWKRRANPQLFYERFDGTAPTHHLFGLREALNILVHEEGIEAAWKRHQTIAEAIWAALDVWGETGNIRHNIAYRNLRSNAVSSVCIENGDATKLRVWTEEFAGVILGIGLGFPPPAYDSQLRIGHMGHQNIPMTMAVLGSIDAGLKALDIPHGHGALDAATKILAAHKD